MTPVRSPVPQMPMNYWYSRALAPKYAAAPVASQGAHQFVNGGPDGGDVADASGQGRNQAPFDKEAFSRDFGKLMDMVAGVSPSLSAVNMMTGGYAGVGPSMAGAGLGYSGGWDSSAEGDEGAAIEADAKGEAASGNVDVQALANGGTVKGDKRYGQDDVMISADGDEEVIRAARARELGPKFRKEVQKKKLDRKALVAALRAD